MLASKLYNSLDEQFKERIGEEAAFEAELFENFVEWQRDLLYSVAIHSTVINATILSDGSGAELSYELNKLVSQSPIMSVTLQNITGSVLKQNGSTALANYNENAPWVQAVLNGNIPYHFQLLSQLNDNFTFKLSLPIKYQNNIKGIISKEISMPLKRAVIALSFKEHVGITLEQDSVSIQSELNTIVEPTKRVTNIDALDVKFTYIVDRAGVEAKIKTTRTYFLLLVTAGLLLSFVLFTQFGANSYKDKTGGVTSALSSKNAYALAITIALIGIISTMLLFWLIKHLFESNHQHDATASSMALVDNMQLQIRNDLEVLDALKAFLLSSNFADRGEFSYFTNVLLNRHNHIQSIEWAPNVAASDRDEFEKRASNDGFKNFLIRERRSNGDLVKAGTRDHYFPVFYAEPLASNKSVVGFDLSSNPAFSLALLRAASTGEKIATRPTKLLQRASSSKIGVVTFLPVFKKQVQPEASLSSALERVDGFVLLVLGVEGIINTITKNLERSPRIFIQDVTDVQSPQIVFGQPISTAEETYRALIHIAGRAWEIKTSFNMDNHGINWLAWSIVLVGILFTSLITIGLLYLIQRREIVEAIVSERTAELSMLSKVVSHSRDSIVIADANKGNNNSILSSMIYVNDAYSNLSGYSIDESIGKSPTVLASQETDNNKLEQIDDYIRQGKIYFGEIQCVAKDQSEFWVDLGIYPIGENATSDYRYALIMRDITESKHQQKERELLIDKLTDSNEELERFAYICSHDLQEPLRMIRSYTDKLQEKLEFDEDDDPQLAKYLYFVTDGAQRAQELISDILTYSALDNDATQLKTVNINEILTSIVRNMEVVFLKKNASVTWDEMPQVQANNTQIYQLFQNLINNAVKYQVESKQPCVHISVKQSGEHWLFAVEDNGIGIEEKNKVKIFNVFQRLHRRSQYSGTGIGLSICKKIVQRHAGTIWVESRPGIGSTFYFTLLKPELKEKTDG